MTEQRIEEPSQEEGRISAQEMIKILLDTIRAYESTTGILNNKPEDK